MAETPFTSTLAATPLALALSHAVIAILLLAALLLIRDARQSLQGRLLALLTVSVAALEIATGPSSDALASSVQTLLRLIGVLNLALLWLFCLSILRDDFRLGWLEWLGAAALVLGPLLVLLPSSVGTAIPVIAVFSSIAPFAMIGHVGWVAFAERSGDLIDARRRARVWMPLALIAAAAISVLSEEVSDAATASLIRNGLASLPIALGLLWWLAALDPARLRFEATPTSPEAKPQVDVRDKALHAALLAMMRDANLHRQPDLTIDNLAERLKTPAHRLRCLINGGLGFRNFAAFINGYRLADAKAALADPARARETILSIAFAAGFTSLPTFNRVFRETEGVTPTVFRTQALSEPDQNQKTLLPS